jgi:hypothetical protein
MTTAQPASALPSAAPTRIGPVGAVGAAWVLSLAFDLFLHAGLLARLYAPSGPALLPAEAAFARIPLGYAPVATVAAATVVLRALGLVPAMQTVGAGA